MHTRMTLLAVSLGFGAVCQVVAGPKGGVVVSGQGAISTPNANTTLINQSSNQLQLNWSSFNVGSSESVQFVQPSSTAVAFNRILDQSPSQIFGHIQGNGQVVLINPNGFLIGRTAQLNVNSLVVSSLDAIDFDAASGRYRFSSVGNPGAVINEGTITAGHGGSVTLLGGQVSNSGSIVADYGTVNLAAGRTATLDLAGDGLLRLEVGSELLANSSGAASAVENSGSIQANGGRVLLTASAVNDVFSRLVNNTGIVRANRIDNSGGTIELLGPGGEVVSSGTLDASAGDSQSTGGSVSVLGKYVGLFDSAAVNVSGAKGGGTALIGGDYHGANPDVLNAQETFVSSSATINADAGSTGDGGHVVVWSDGVTHFNGNISARGGSASGNGGYVEVSGKEALAFAGDADLSAPHGAVGTILLDPKTLTIDSSNDDPYPNAQTIDFTTDPNVDKTIGASTVETLLSKGDVVLSANTDLNQTADIASTFSSQLSLLSKGTVELAGINIGGALTVSAGTNITLNGALSSTGVTISSDHTGAGTLQMIPAASINANGGAVSITVPGSAVLSTIRGGAVNITADTITTGSGTLQSTNLQLSAASGIGSAGSPLSTKADQITASSTTGDIYIAQSGFTTLQSMSAAGAGATINISGGSSDTFTVGSVSAANHGTVNLSAGWLADDLNKSSYINADTIILNGRTGVGGPGGTQQIDVTGGTVSATAIIGGVYLHSADDVTLADIAAPGPVNVANDHGDILTGSISTSSGVSLNSAGRIANAGGTITAASLNLTAATGIGQQGNALQTANAPGAVIVPVTATTTTGDIEISNQGILSLSTVSTGGSGSKIEISTGTSGDLIVSSVDAHLGGTVNLTGFDILSASSSSLINAPTVELTATGNTAGVGASVTPINILGGALAASANAGGVFVHSQNAVTLSSVTSNAGSISITADSGNIAADIVSAPTNITLTATGGGISGTGANRQLSTDVLILTAANGIGSQATPLASTASQLAATTGNGGIYLGNQGDLTLANVVAAGAGNDVSISTASGNLTVQTVSAPDSVTLAANAGAILAGGGSSIGGATLSMTAGTNIGAAGTNNQIVTNVGSFSATANGGGIYIGAVNATTVTSAKALGGTSDISITSAGDLTVDVVNASGNVSLASSFGSIIGNASTSVTGDALTMTASGQIGSSAQPITTSVDSLTAFTSNSGIYVTNTDALTVTNVAAGGSFGDIGITALTGDLTIDGVSTPGSAALTAKTGSILADGNTGTIGAQVGVNLQAALNVGSVTDFATLAGAPLQISTSSLTVAAKANGGQINLEISGTPVIGTGGIALGSGSGTRTGVVLLQSTSDLNVAGIAPGAISIGAGNQAQVGLSAGGMGAGTSGVLTLPPGGGFTDAPAYSLLLHGATDIVNTSQSPRDLAIDAATLSFLSGSTGGATTLETSVGRLDAVIGNSQSLTVNQTGSMTLGAISDVGGTLSVLATGGALNGDGVTTSPQLIAGGIVLSGSSLGTVNSIYTQAGTLNATSTAGAIHIREADGVTLTANATGGVVDVQTANGAMTVSQVSGSGVTLSGNTLTVNGLVNGGGQAVSLTAGGDIDLNAVVSSPGATVTLTANSGSIVAGAGNGIVGGSLTATGLGIGSATGRLNTSVGSLNATATNGIYVTEADTLALTATAAAGPVDVQTTNGSMTVASVTGTGVTLAANGDGNFLTLTGAVNGRTGDIGLTTTGANRQINVNNTVTTSGNVVLSAGPGSIRSNGGHITGAALTATGASIGTSADPLNTTVASLNAASGSGDIYAQNAGPLTLSATATGGAVQVSTTNGGMTVLAATGDGVNLTAGGDLDVEGTVGAGSGQVKLTATGAILAGTANMVSGSSGVFRGASIGASGARLNTALSSLDAATTAGGIFVTNTDALSLIAAAGGGAVDIQSTNGGLTVTSATGSNLSFGANGDVALTGNLTTPGAIAITTSGTVNGPGSLLASAVDLTGSSIGVSTARLNTTAASLNVTSTNGATFIKDTNSVALTGSATGGVLDVQTGGALTVNSASSDTGITLAAAGAITQGAGSVSAPSLSATATSIGSATNALSTAVATLNTVSTNGGTFVNQAGALTLNATATGGEVNVQTANGALTVTGASGTGVTLVAGGPNNSITLDGLISGGNAPVTLTAGTSSSGGAIVVDSGGLVTGTTLNATGVSIGTNAAFLSTNIDTLNATASRGGIYINEQDGLTLANVQSGSDLNITTATGNITVGSVSAANYAILTAAAGAISDDGVDSTVLSGHSVDLLAKSIGGSSTSSQRLDIVANTLNATSTAGGIYIDAQNGLASVSVQANGGVNGNIELMAPNGDLNLLSVSASNTLLLSAGRNILGLPGLGTISARSAELRAGSSDPSAGHIGTLIAPLSFQLDPGNTLRIFVPQTVSSNDPNRAPATLPSAGVLTTLSLFNAPNSLALEVGYGDFQGLSDSLYTSQAESLVHTIQNQTVVQTVVGLDWGALDPNVSLFGTLDPSVCLPSDQRDEERGAAGC